MYIIQGDNPTQLYFQSLSDLFFTGDRVAPRGKLIREMRPACFEFINPYNRVTFLHGRRINPFFQVAESLWILSGRADVEWLQVFNKNIAQFSDDGKWFNASYGERMRTWNKNALHSFILNPVDQLVDVYRKILADPDTRQAVIVLSNPMFDNSTYTIDEHGKDICCNLCLTFKIRQNKFHMTVFNRSNDIHWGLFGANLCQFSTIQETLFSWLKHSGYPQFVQLEMGTYNHITDSLHVYLDDYGAKITEDVLSQYQTESARKTLDVPFTFSSEPRMTLSAEKFSTFLVMFWQVLDPYLMDNEVILDKQKRDKVFNPLSQNSIIATNLTAGNIDEYWNFAVQSMVAYRLAKLGHVDTSLEILDATPDCQWKVSMLYFLQPFIRKLTSRRDETIQAYNGIVEKLCLNLSSGSEMLSDYLKFNGGNKYEEPKKPADVV